MKVIRLTHMRCNEWDDTAFYIAPDSMTSDDIRAAIDAAQDDYLNALQAASKELPKLPPRPDTYIDKYPDNMTVGEIRAASEAWNKASNEQEALKAKITTSFEKHLLKRGIMTLYTYYYDNEDSSNEFDVDWGHRHGVSIKYQ